MWLAWSLIAVNSVQIKSGIVCMLMIYSIQSARLFHSTYANRSPDRIRFVKINQNGSRTTKLIDNIADGRYPYFQELAA